MPSLIDLRRRIRAVKSTQQITKAMKMIAASRLKRAQDRIVAARPFAQLMLRVLNGLVSNIEAEMHPLLRQPSADGRPLLIVITGDRGLSGSFNSNVIKAAGQFIVNEGRDRQIALGLIGRKGRDFFRRRPQYKVSGELLGVMNNVQFNDAGALAREIAGRYRDGLVDAVYVVNNEFKSVIASNLVTTKVLPVALSEASATDYIFEQPPAHILSRLLPQYVEIEIYRAMLESAAAEHAARMTAMDSATRNAGEMIEKLTLYLNRIRQASITKEIIEVVSGAAALD